MAEDLGPSRRWLHQAQQDAHGGGLPGAVRPQQGNHFSRFDGEIDAAQGGDLAVILGDGVQFGDWHACSLHLR
jgi:hypothetical protein